MQLSEVLKTNVPVFINTTTNQFTHSKQGNVTIDTRSSMKHRF
jgi:hypothetical protein